MAATNKLIILVLLICLLPHIVFSSTSAKDNDTKAYVDSWCQTTKYQERCVRSLSPYVSLRANQSPEEVFRLMLVKGLTDAIDTLKFLVKLMTNPVIANSKVIMECAIRLNSLIFQLTKLLERILHLHDNNLQRWTSTALTDAETLVSKFEGRRLSKLESTIYGKVKNVEETTSNAISIIQHYAATRH